MKYQQKIKSNQFLKIFPKEYKQLLSDENI